MAVKITKEEANQIAQEAIDYWKSIGLTPPKKRPKNK